MPWFDATTTGWPRIVANAAFAAAPAGVCVVDTGVVDTDVVGGPGMVDISADIRSVRWTRGRDSDIDTATPGSATIVVNNISGDYDPTNLQGPYVTGDGVGAVYSGVHTQNNLSSLQSVLDFEIAAGKQVSIIHFFSSWGSTDGSQNFNTTQMQQIRDHGSIPLVTWEPWDPSGTATQPAYQLADIIAGNYDSYMTTWLNAAKAWGHPFFLRFAHEMNGDWYPWSEQVNGNSAGQYVTAWQHVRDLATTLGVTNATWVWCPNRIYVGSTALSGLYPGDAYCDWTGLDAYNRGTEDGGTWDSFSGRVKETYDTILGLASSKPMMLAETGCVEGGGSKADWFTDALQIQLPLAFPKLRAWVYFHKLKTYDYRITSSAGAQAAYAAGMTQPWYATNTFAAAATTPIGVNGTESTPNRLSGDTAVLETSVGSWLTNTNSPTVAWSTVVAYGGSGSLLATSTIAGTFSVRHSAGSAGVPVTAGTVWTSGGWSRPADATTRQFQAGINWFDSGGVFLSSSVGTAVDTFSGAWVQATCTATAPVSAARAVVVMRWLSAAAAGEAFYLDDTSIVAGTVSSEPSAARSLVDLGAAMTIQAERPSGMLYDRFVGEIVDISLDAGIDPTVTFTVADGLEKLGRVQLPVEQAEFAGDTSGQRIGNLADRAAWPTTARLLDRGQVTFGPTILGAGALELMRQVELSEFGLLFVDEHGNLVFYERHRTTTASRSVTVQARLTDTSGTDELGMVELVVSKSRERIFNDVHVTRDPDPTQDPELTGSSPGDAPVEQVAQDPTSIGPPGNYGTLSFPAQVGQLLASDADALALAQGLVGLYSQPRPRIREVQINALHPRVTDEDLWPTLLTLGLLDRIAVSRDYGPNRITADLLIQQVTEEIDSAEPSWTLTFTTAEPPPSVNYCVVDGGVVDTDQVGW